MSGLQSGNDNVQPVKPDTSADGINDFLNSGGEEDKPIKLVEDKEDKPVKKTAKTEETETDDEIELKGEEDSVEDEEEKLDLKDEDIKIDTPPRKKEIITKYPNLFKDFPYIEKAIYRDRQYSELFGSFDDAKEVAEQAQVLQEFEQDILKGSTEKILTSVKELDKKAYDKLIDNYLPTLHKVDQEAYFEIVGNIGKSFIAHMVKEAKASQNEDLQKAALILNQFLFSSSTYTPPKTRVQENKTQDSEIEKERSEFVRERLETAVTDLQSKVDNVLRGTISEYIDPKGEMSSYEKKNAINDALRMLHDELGNDKSFRKTLDRLWSGASNEKFNKNSLDKIRSTYLGRSKQSLGTIIKKARAEALKDSVPTSRKREDNEEETTPRRRTSGLGNTGRPHQSSGKQQWDRKNETVADFLSRD